MERANICDIVRHEEVYFLILNFCMNFGLKSENKCATKAQNKMESTSHKVWIMFKTEHLNT